MLLLTLVIATNDLKLNLSSLNILIENNNIELINQLGQSFKKLIKLSDLIFECNTLLSNFLFDLKNEKLEYLYLV